VKQGEELWRNGRGGSGRRLVACHTGRTTHNGAGHHKAESKERGRGLGDHRHDRALLIVRPRSSCDPTRRAIVVIVRECPSGHREHRSPPDPDVGDHPVGSAVASSHTVR